MGVLDQLLEYKKYKDAQSNADLQAIPQAAMLYQQAKQQQLENTIKTLTLQGTLAKSGIGIGPNNKLVQDDRFLNSQNKGVYTVDAQGNLVQAGTVPGKSVVKQLPLTPEEIGKRSEASRNAVVENPVLNEKTQGAIAALEFLNPRLDNAISLLDKIGKKDFEKLSNQITIGLNNELIVPNGSPLEDLVAEINDAKLTGFKIAGSAYSDTEKQTVEGGFNPIGKSFERYKRDILRNKDYFSATAKAGTMGLKEARQKSSEGDAYSSGNKKVGKFKIVSVQ